ncbi:hypothetical protein FRX31_024408 [Thalictrum thalictroides]|uniref:RNase H type-1 domain-containing protein n=1 Tax=Thalictrum thalictroides TaxID=46969 RepID=A0A7J6VP87_THATH|nr:hypothetical protein FRX31_024408 [Thalictrum thalictroides]
MNLQEEMPYSIWIEGANFSGFWQQITYPNFLYCSSCAKIGHSWENCRHRRQNGMANPNLETQKNNQPINSTQAQKTYNQLQHLSLTKKILPFFNLKRPQNLFEILATEEESRDPQDPPVVPGDKENQSPPAENEVVVQTPSPMASSPTFGQPTSIEAIAETYTEATTTESLSGLAGKEFPATQMHEDLNHEVRVSKSPVISNANVEMEDHTTVLEIVARVEAHEGHGCHKESMSAGSSHQHSRDSPDMVVAIAQASPSAKLLTWTDSKFFNYDGADSDEEEEEDEDIGEQAIISYGSDTEITRKKKPIPPMSMITSLEYATKTPPFKAPTIVFWTRPPDNYVALNTDGTWKDGLAAGGGVIRRGDGSHISNFFSFYGPGTNNLAESRAILDGIALCVLMGYTNIQLQTDSKLALGWLNRDLRIPWFLKVWWRHIQEYL